MSNKEENNVPSAQQFLKDNKLWEAIPTFYEALIWSDTLREFAQLHVEKYKQDILKEVEEHFGYDIEAIVRTVVNAADNGLNIN